MAAMSTGIPPSAPLLPSSAPPPYSVPTASSNRLSNSNLHSKSHLCLPSGYFVIQSKAKGRRVMDVLGQRSEDGAPVGLYSYKETNGSNQLFYLNWEGQLMSVSTQKAVDCVDSSLSVSFPKPISASPTLACHPHPLFAFDATTQTLRVIFAADPSYPDDEDLSTNWQDSDYLIESVPLKRSKEEAPTAVVWAATSGLLGKLFGGAVTAETPMSSPASGIAHEVTAADSTLDDSDDDMEPSRALRVVRLHSSWRDKFPVECLGTTRQHIDPSRAKEVRKWRRRQFNIVPMIVRNENGGTVISPLRNTLVNNNVDRPVIPASTYPGTTSGTRALRLASSASTSVSASSSRNIPTSFPVSASSSSSTLSSSPPFSATVATSSTATPRWSALLGLPRPAIPLLGRPSRSSSASSSTSPLDPTTSPTKPAVSTSPSVSRSQSGADETEEEEELEEEFIPKSLGDWSDARPLSKETVDCVVLVDHADVREEITADKAAAEVKRVVEVAEEKHEETIERESAVDQEEVLKANATLESSTGDIGEAE